MSMLTGYALHITELNIGVENALRQGPPFDVREIYFDPVGAQRRDGPASLYDVVRSPFTCPLSSGMDTGLSSMTYLTLTSGCGFLLAARYDG